MEDMNKKPEEDIELTSEEEEALKNIKANLKNKLEAAEAEKAERDAGPAKPQEEPEEEPVVVIGKAAVDGVAVKTKDLVNATEDYPIVLLVHDDFEPVKVGDEVKTPYDAVLRMDEIQIVGPMIRVIIKPEKGYNTEA